MISFIFGEKGEFFEQVIPGKNSKRIPPDQALCSVMLFKVPASPFYKAIEKLGRKDGAETLVRPKRKERKMKRRLAIWATWYMVSVMFLIGITPRVYADFSPSELITLSQNDRNSDLLKVQKVLESKMIRERLGQLGFTEEGIQQRLYQLSDEQIHQMALKIDELKIGGDAGEAVIIGFVVIIFIVAVVYFLGYRLVLKQ